MNINCLNISSENGFEPQKFNSYSNISSTSSDGSTYIDYIYKYCGKERDEETGLYYYGARYYASWLCRFVSVDPIKEKHQNTSPYVYCVNNPIKYIDPDGRDNVIYLVAQQSAEKHLSKEEMQSIVDDANKNYEGMGLNTRVKLWDKEEQFDFSKINKTDGMVVIGSPNEVKDFIQSQIPSDVFDEHFANWGGSTNNPERSSNKVNAIAIDAEGIKGFSKKVGLTVGEAGGFIIIHGSGHNAGFNNHSNVKWGIPQEKSILNSLVMATGGFIQSALTERSVIDPDVGQLITIDNPNWKKITDFYKKEYNSLFIKMMEQKFGTNKSVDNYDKESSNTNQNKYERIYKVPHY